MSWSNAVRWSWSPYLGREGTVAGPLVLRIAMSGPFFVNEEPNASASRSPQHVLGTGLLFAVLLNGRVVMLGFAAVVLKKFTGLGIAASSRSFAFSLG